MFFSIKLKLWLSLVSISLLEGVRAAPLSHDCHGSGACGVLDDSQCTQAYSQFNSNQTYSGYTSNVFVGMGSGSDPPAGCTAIFQCHNKGDYKQSGSGQGFSGQEIIAAFDAILGDDGCGPCGSQQISDSCFATLNYCDHCVSLS